MNRNPTLPVVLACALCVPAFAQDQVSPWEEVRAEIASLAARVDQLEAENVALKARNDDLERRLTATPPATTPEVARDAAAAAAPPAWYDSLKVSGYLFGDAYAVLANHDHSIEDQTGFWVRRAYLTFDTAVAEGWAARLRFEMNSPGDFTTNSKLEPFVKDAYLAFKHAGRELDLGLSSSPTFEYVEGFWGYRALEKTPLDLYRMGSSRDLGIAYKGGFYGGRFFYHAMFGNGAGDGAETNKGKKAMASLGFKPMDRLVMQAYADYEDRPGTSDRTTWQAFLGWSGERSRYGLQYASQNRESPDGPDDTIAVASAFGVWKLTSQGTLIARYDRSFDGYPDATGIPYLRIVNQTRFDLAIVGWEQRLASRVSLIPNFEYVRYRSTDGAAAPDDDLYGRLTLFYEF